MNFIDALKQIHEQGMCPTFSFEIECELGCSAESGSLKVDVGCSSPDLFFQLNYSTLLMFS